MLQALISLFAWMFPFALPAVVAEEVDLSVSGGAIHSTHAGGLETLATAVDGRVICAFGGTGGDVGSIRTGSGGIIGITILPIRGGTWSGTVDMEEPAVVLRSSWKDANNTTWEVVVPVVSTTPAGQRKAEELLDSLTASLQRRHPPV